MLLHFYLFFSNVYTLCFVNDALKFVALTYMNKICCGFWIVSIIPVLLHVYGDTIACFFLSFLFLFCRFSGHDDTDSGYFP